MVYAGFMFNPINSGPVNFLQPMRAFLVFSQGGAILAGGAVPKVLNLW
jgi:hypothetical protein